MLDAPPSIDLETREFLAELKDTQNPAIVAFIETQEGRTQPLQQPLSALGITLLGIAESVAIVRAPIRSLMQAASLDGVLGIEGWPSADRQQGPDPSDVQQLKNNPSAGQRQIAALVRLRVEPDAAAKETLSLVGLKLFPDQSEPVRAGTIPANALDDVLAIPAIAAVKISRASLVHASATAPELTQAASNPGKIGAPTRMLLQQTPAQSNPTVAVFVEFGSAPTADEKAQMEALGLQLTPGGGAIKTGRIPLRSIFPLSALGCVSSIEASSPLHLDRTNLTDSDNSSNPEP